MLSLNIQLMLCIVILCVSKAGTSVYCTERKGVKEKEQPVLVMGNSAGSAECTDLKPRYINT